MLGSEEPTERDTLSYFLDAILGGVPQGKGKRSNEIKSQRVRRYMLLAHELNY